MCYCQNGWECVKIVELILGTQGRGARAAHQTLNLLILVRIQAPLPCEKKRLLEDMAWYYIAV